MKLHELTTDQQLNELDWRKAVAGGALAASAFTAPTLIDKLSRPKPAAEQTAQDNRVAQGRVEKATKELGKRKGIDQLTQIVLAKYKKVDPNTARQIAELATKYAKPTFPTATDILSIIGIESSFRPDAVSKLKRDPARGLMQVRPGVWGITPEDLNDIEKQIKFGSQILHDYYTKLGDVDSAIHAFNVGITNFRKKKGLNPGYVDKYKNERKLYHPDTVAQNNVS